VLTYCEASSLPAVLYVCYIRERALDTATVTAFRQLRQHPSLATVIVVSNQLILVLCRFLLPLDFPLQCFDSVGWANRNGNRPAKKRVLVCWWWQFDCLLARLLPPPPSPLAPMKPRVKTLWYQITRVQLKKMAVKTHRESLEAVCLECFDAVV